MVAFMSTPQSTLARVTAYVTWLSWMVLFAGTHHLPGFFERDHVFISLIGLVAVGAPLTILFAIRYAMMQGRWRTSCLLVLAGAIPLGSTAGSSGFRILEVDRISIFLLENDLQIGLPNDGMLDDARDENRELEDRRSIAWAVYYYWGLRILWLNEEGELVPFVPDAEVLEMRAARLALDAWARERDIQFQREAQRGRAIFIFQTGMFLAVLIPGLMIITRRREKPI